MASGSTNFKRMAYFADGRIGASSSGHLWLVNAVKVRAWV